LSTILSVNFWVVFSSKVVLIWVIYS
jgi:hypothetical protein